MLNIWLSLLHAHMQCGDVQPLSCAAPPSGATCNKALQQAACDRGLAARAAVLVLLMPRQGHQLAHDTTNRRWQHMPPSCGAPCVMSMASCMNAYLLSCCMSRLQSRARLLLSLLSTNASKLLSMTCKQGIAGRSKPSASTPSMLTWSTGANSSLPATQHSVR